MANVVVNDTSLLDIGNAIREKNGEQTKYKPDAMGAAIRAISGGGGGAEPPAEALVLSGDCARWYKNKQNQWFYDTFKDKMSTKDITDAANMFSNFQGDSIPFDINLAMSHSLQSQSTFSGCSHLRQAPKIKLSFDKNKDYYSISFSNMFTSCSALKSISSNFFTDINPDIFSIKLRPQNGYFEIERIFNDCYNLENIPELTQLYLFNKMDVKININNAISKCYKIKEIDLPVTAKTTGSTTQLGTLTPRLRSITFDKNRKYYQGEILDSTGIVYNAEEAGYCPYNPKPVPEEKGIADDASYATLKNDPDAWASKAEYSFYNHDSAVETINSLPNTSGANTITFTGISGSKTDGGAINTLTPEEIAIATNKGFTVSFV